MQFDLEREFRRDALECFPTPIADTLDDALNESSYRAQRDKVVEIFRVAVRMIALIALAGMPIGLPRGTHLDRLIFKLRRQGLTDGEWVGVAREVCRILKQSSTNHGLQSLVNMFFDERGNLTKTFEADGSCDHLLAMRKNDTVAHGVSGTEDTAQCILRARAQDISDFLYSTRWLWSHPVVIPVTKSALTSASFKYAVIKMNGVTRRRGPRRDVIESSTDLIFRHVYLLCPENRAIVDLFPFVQFCDSQGEGDLFLFEEVSNKEVVLRCFPNGAKFSDPNAITVLHEKLNSAEQPRTSGSIEDLKNNVANLEHAARQSTNEYLSRMQRERTYIAQTYSRRFDTERHLSGFVDSNCTKSGLLLVGAAGRGKTSTICHVVEHWQKIGEESRRDIILLMGGETLPRQEVRILGVVMERLGCGGADGGSLALLEMTLSNACRRLILVVDGVDKHPYPAEVMRQLDEIVARAMHVPTIKVIVSLSQSTYDDVKRNGFVPTVSAYYTTCDEMRVDSRENGEVVLGRMTDSELAEAFEKYRRTGEYSSTSEFRTLSEEVRDVLKDPFVLRIALEVYRGRAIPNRTITADLLLQYSRKKVFNDMGRVFVINRLIDALYERRQTRIAVSELAEDRELRRVLVEQDTISPMKQLLNEQVLVERSEVVVSFLPVRRYIAFSNDRLLEYLLFNRIVERQGITSDTVSRLSRETAMYAPLRGVLAMMMHALLGSGRIPEVVAAFSGGESGVMSSALLEALCMYEQAQSAIEAGGREGAAVMTTDEIVRELACCTGGLVKNALIEFGNRLREEGRHERAAKVYDSIYGVTTLEDSRHLRAKVLFGSGCTKYVVSDKREALKELEEATTLYEECGDLAGQQEALDVVGRVYQDVGEMALARRAFNESLRIDEIRLAECPNDEDAVHGKIASLINLAECERIAGNLVIALEWAAAARDLSEAVEDKRRIAEVLAICGEVNRRLGDLHGSREQLAKSLAMYQQIGDRRGIAEGLRRIARGLTSLGRWKEAEEQYQEALELYTEMRDLFGISTVWNSIGEVQRWSGRIEDALLSYRKALDVAGVAGAERMVRISTGNIGTGLLCRGDTAPAVEYLERAIEMQRQQLGIEGLPETLSYLSRAKRESGDMAAALQLSDAAIRVLSKQAFGAEDWQIVWFERYRVLSALGRVPEANDALETAYRDVRKQADIIALEVDREDYVNGFPLRRSIVNEWNGKLL